LADVENGVGGVLFPMLATNKSRPPTPPARRTASSARPFILGDGIVPDLQR